MEAIAYLAMEVFDLAGLNVFSSDRRGGETEAGAEIIVDLIGDIAEVVYLGWYPDRRFVSQASESVMRIF